MKKDTPRTLITLLLGLLAAVSGGQALAEDGFDSRMTLEDLLGVRVVTASKSLEKLSESPGVVTVITRKELEEFGGNSLADILDRVPSLQMMSSHLFVTAKPVIRGDLMSHADNHTLVLINGRPYRDALESSTNTMIYSSFPIGLIERIEVVRGPGSVLYGSNAMAGVINIITRSQDDDARASVSGGGGSFGTKLGAFEGSWARKGWKAAAGGRYLDQDGWNFRQATNHPVFGRNSIDMKYGQAFTSVAAFASYKDRVSAQFLYNDGHKDSLGPLPDPSTIQETGGNRMFVDLGYTQPLPLPGKWEAKASFTMNDLDRIWIPRSTGVEGIQNTRSLLGEVSVSGSIGAKTDVILGGLLEERKNSGVATTNLPLYTDTHRSFYAQVEHQAAQSLKLLAGAQSNRGPDGRSALVPRFGVIYNLSAAATLKVLYGQAYRSAMPLEKYLTSPRVRGNPDLEPELATTFDTQLFYGGKRGQYTLSVYNTRYRDLINRRDLGGGVEGHQNGGRNELRGIELEAKQYLASSLFMTGSVTVQDEKDNTLYIPSHLAKVGLSHQRGPLTAGLFLSRFGAPRKNSPLGGLELNTPVSAIHLLSLNVSYRPKSLRHVEVNVYGTNLLDEDTAYTEFARGWVNTLPIGPSRAVTGRLTLSF